MIISYYSVQYYEMFALVPLNEIRMHQKSDGTLNRLSGTIYYVSDFNVNN